MNVQLLVVERMVLESLIKGDKTITQIALDTKIQKRVLTNILANCLSNGFISFRKGFYSLNNKTKLEWLPAINKKDHVKEEVKELFSSLTNNYFSKEKNNAQLKMQKLSMTKDEEVIFKSLIYNIEFFISSIKSDRSRRPIKEKTCDQTIIFWGHSNYAEVVKSTLSLN